MYFGPHSLFLHLSKQTKDCLLPPSNNHLYSSQTQTSDLAKTLAIHLDSSCSDLKTLTQIHTRMLRLALLQFPFHWNSLMRSYLRLSRPGATLALFAQMRLWGRHPDSYTLPLALKAACYVFASALGRQLHSLSIKLGLHRHEYSESGLISFYAKSGFSESARKVFNENPERKIGSWNAMINGLVHDGNATEAIRLFVEMRESGLVPDELTMVSVVSACGGLGDVGLAEQVHKLALQGGSLLCRSNAHVLEVNNVMIGAESKRGQFTMREQCPFIRLLTTWRSVHNPRLKPLKVKALERLDITLSNSLLDMYCKCGRTDLAYQVFARMTQRNVSTWTAMITGLGTHGQEKLALDFFLRMRQEGVQPNHVTMVGVLNACAHGGLVEEGMEFLDNMNTQFGVEPKAVHYGCVVDMLGRVGRMKEARKIAEKMPMGLNAVVWGTLLGASEKHGDVEVGEWAAKSLMELEPWNDGVYVVLSNIYAAAGMWGKVEKLRKDMRERGVEKIPSYSMSTRDL